MDAITGTIQHYAWGSRSVLADFMGQPATGEPWAEVWFGAHKLGPTRFGEGTIADAIARDPRSILGEAVVQEFGPRLPYLVKFLAANAPLSLQVHPSKQRAEAGWLHEEHAGLALAAPGRNYRDANHKPELIYALTRLEALSGFRAPRRALEIVDGLGAPLAREIVSLMRAHPGQASLEKVTHFLLDEDTRPDAEAVAATIAACAERLSLGASPSVRADRIVAQLGEAYPGDPAVVLALLLNPVTLQAGQTLFTPAGSLHCYLHGLGVEVMADSDNVLRAGLTRKHTDVDEALATTVFHGAPPVRIAAEDTSEHTQTFYAPVPDFELSLTRIPFGQRIDVAGCGPRIIACVEGCVDASCGGTTLTLRRGGAAFIPATDGALSVSGEGRLIQVSVP
ncbi:mannose-6-phosphate isomerase, class I [Nanchangia anserum]|uniref:mannose-6-phosphate isomerase n=1 Tax=Nanchangia anserum TaxID=2692125 RepID=A0A8I0GHH9_9ACTO|nr:mannose-6-phosphate isomerase, class I [Nanchangia anserum]MBD3690079.1 mannose-6-phosphate isomerase, class I [Nanchangia anserum]QOX82129.1 mannose-6-phosphate isomerase, class I [Nanchangia anserum]